MEHEQHEQARGVSPVFLAMRDLPTADSTPYTTREICASAERIGGFGSVIGAQRMGSLWRVYPKDRDTRVKLLLEGFTLRGLLITPYDKNPFIVAHSKDQPIATKVLIGGVPLSYSDREIEGKLVAIGCKLRSKLLLERDRDERGGLTRWLTGRRFVYIDVPKTPLPARLLIGSYQASVYHREQKKENSDTSTPTSESASTTTTVSASTSEPEEPVMSEEPVGPEETVVPVVSELPVITTSALSFPSATLLLSQTTPASRGRADKQTKLNFLGRARSASSSGKRLRTSPTVSSTEKAPRTEAEPRQQEDKGDSPMEGSTADAT